MQKISKYAAAVSLCLTGASLAGCSATEPQSTTGIDRQWFEDVFDDEYSAKAFTGGGGTLGSSITADGFTAGWFAVDLVCKGTSDATFAISQNGSTLGEETAGCSGGGFTTTTMDLPAGSISATATGGNPNTRWYVRFRPTEAPTP